MQRRGGGSERAEAGEGCLVDGRGDGIGGGGGEERVRGDGGNGGNGGDGGGPAELGLLRRQRQRVLVEALEVPARVVSELRLHALTCHALILYQNGQHNQSAKSIYKTDPADMSYIPAILAANTLLLAIAIVNLGPPILFYLYSDAPIRQYLLYVIMPLGILYNIIDPCQKKQGRTNAWFASHFPPFSILRRHISLTVSLSSPKTFRAMEAKPGAQFIYAIFPHGVGSDFRVLLQGMLPEFLPNTATKVSKRQERGEAKRAERREQFSDNPSSGAEPEEKENGATQALQRLSTPLFTPFLCVPFTPCLFTRVCSPVFVHTCLFTRRVCSHVFVHTCFPSGPLAGGLRSFHNPSPPLHHPHDRLRRRLPRDGSAQPQGW